MKYLGAISDAKDLVNKGYVDDHDGIVSQVWTNENSSLPVLLANSSTEISVVQQVKKSSLSFNGSTRNLYVSTGTTNGNIYLGLSTSDALYTAINNLGWTSAVIE